MALALAVRSSIPNCSVLLGAGSISVPQIKQEQKNWCWAACTDMIASYYGNAALRQCACANWLFGRSDCCGSPGSSDCDRGCAVDDVSRVLAHFGIHSSLINGTVPFSTLKTEVDAARPVEVAYFWSSGGGHVAIVCAWDHNTTGDFVRVNDPAYGSGGVYYKNLLTAYGMGKWVYTWTDIRK